MRAISNISWSVLTILILFTGCSEVIDLGSQENRSQTLIYGRITTGFEGNIIEIARTSPINNTQIPVDGAEVVLVSGDGQREQYRRVGPGKYQLFNQDIVARSGESYHVEVNLTDGSQYRSIPAVMPEAVATNTLDIESKSLEIQLENNQGTIRRNVVELYMTTQLLDPEKDNFIRWNLVETYLFPERTREVFIPDPPPQWCYITNDLEEQQVFLYDGSTLKAPEIARRLMTTRLADNSFVSEYYFQVVQSSLTPDAFRYWEELNEVANSVGSIFDRPMGPVGSNLFNVNDPEEEVLGYFEVSRVDTTRLLVRANDTPFDIRSPCPIVGQVGDVCFNCLILENSVKVKPYFVD